MYYVYILNNPKVGKLYIGYTSNLKRRLREHELGRVRTTRVFGKNIKLIYYEAYRDQQDAKNRERSFKMSGSVYNGLVKRIKRSREGL